MLRFLLLMVSVMAVGASTAKGVSECPVDAVPVQFVLDAAEFVARGARDPAIGAVTTLSVPGHEVKWLFSYYPHFRAFMTAVTEHVAVRLAEDKLCIDSAESKERSLLQFVNWPLRGYWYDSPSVPPLDVRPSGGCRISSPWIDLAFERKPVPWIRAIVRWNDRQMLADQAVLAGAQNVPPGVAKPLTSSEFHRFEREYKDTEVPRRTASRLSRYGIDVAELVRKSMAKPPIEERVPSDLLWLFSRSNHGDRSGNLPDTVMKDVTSKGAESYTKLVTALIDRCFASDGADLHYSSILDAADLIPLEQYKIDMPLKE